MSISSKFSVAVHILILISNADDSLTSAFIAGSVNTNPVVIRRIIGQLKKCNIIESSQGKSGYSFLIPPEELTLLNIYHSVSLSDSEKLFNIHENPNINCPVGAHIQGALEGILNNAQWAMESVLKNVTLQDLRENFPLT